MDAPVSGRSGEVPPQRRVKRSRFSEAPAVPVDYSSAVHTAPQVEHRSVSYHQPLEPTEVMSTNAFPTAEPAGSSPSSLPIVAKRKMGGRVLKTGVLTADKKQKTEEATSKASSSSSAKSTPGSAYLEEMKKYSEQLCAEERHARPLVK